MRRLLLPSLLLCALAASCGPADTGDTFVAFDQDFEGFRNWERISVGDSALPGHPPGPRFAYLNRRPAHGAQEYPVGTIVVKTVETGTPEQWELFAMVKRGGTYNAMGAVGWEWFLLRIGADGHPYVLSRGINPSSDGHGYGEGGGVGPSCNSCHGTSAAAANDYLLSPLLAPSNF
jgi:hypothetical protein